MNQINETVLNNKKCFSTIILSLICIYSFFSLTNFLDCFFGSRVILVVCTAGLTILVCNANKYALYKCEMFLTWSLFIIILFVGSIHNPISIFSVIVEISIGITMLFFCRETDWWGTFFKIIIVFSGLYAISGISQYLCPEYGSALAHVLLPKDGYKSNLHLLDYNYYAGMATQVGYQAFFVMVGIAIAFAMLLNGQYKKNAAYYGVIVFILLISFTALILTKKRSPFFSVIVAIVCCLVLRYRTSKTKTKISVAIISGACLLMLGLLLLITDAGRSLIQRFFEGTFFQSKRFELWSEAFALWIEKPFLGLGTNAFSLSSELSVHNSFLQVLCENGMVGLSVFCVILLQPLVKTVQVYNSISRNSTCHYKYQVYLIASLFVQVFCIVDAFTESVYSNENLFWLLVICEAVPFSIENALSNQPWLDSSWK